MDISERKKLLEEKKEEVEKLKDYKNLYFWIFIIIPALIGLPIMIIGTIALGVWDLAGLGYTFTFVGFSFIIFSGIFAFLFNKKRQKRQELIASLNKDIKELEAEIEEERTREIREIIDTVKKQINALDKSFADGKITNKEYLDSKEKLLTMLEQIK